MTNYQYTTLPFAGLTLDTFRTENGQKWVTMSCMANGLNQSRQQASNWLRRREVPASDQLAVKVGKRQVPATAYPVSLIAEYVQYLADRGNLEAKALLQSTFQADLERTIDEANGVQVTAAQHEARRYSIRMHLIDQWVEDYEGNKEKRTEFYKTATRKEQELVLAKVSLQRWEADLGKPSYYTQEYLEQSVAEARAEVDRLTQAVTIR